MLYALNSPPELKFFINVLNKRRAPGHTILCTGLGHYLDSLHPLTQLDHYLHIIFNSVALERGMGQIEGREG